MTNLCETTDAGEDADRGAAAATQDRGRELATLAPNQIHRHDKPPQRLVSNLRLLSGAGEEEGAGSASGSALESVVGDEYETYGEEEVEIAKAEEEEMKFHPVQTLARNLFGFAVVCAVILLLRFAMRSCRCSRREVEGLLLHVRSVGE